VKRFGRYLVAPALLALAFGLATYGQRGVAGESLLWRYRNLGKAFYENPTTQVQAVEQFRQALALAPESSRERLNYGLALLRTGDMAKGSAELERAQKQDPKLPHTWWNLAITYKKQGDFDKAFTQFEQMARLVPDDAACHYQLGAILKSRNDAPAAVREFEKARDLNPRLAAPHFQLYGLYRQLDRTDAAARELAVFQQLKKEQEGAAVPEDMEWNFYSEIYDPVDTRPQSPLPAPVYRTEKIGSGFDPDTAGLAALTLDGGNRVSLIAWSAARAVLYRGGRVAVADSGLEELRDIVSIAPGDFDNDGLPDLCVITKQGASLYSNVKGRFRKKSDLAAGAFRAAMWLDYDHDYDQDLFLLGEDSRLYRNNGEAGFSDETARFPFVKAAALAAAPFELVADTPGFDLLVRYANRAGVLYRDKLGAAYEAVELAALSGADRARAEALLVAPPLSLTADFDGAGRESQASIGKDGALLVGRNTAVNYGNWIEVALEGVKNAKIPLFAKVEFKAGNRYEKVIYQGVPLVFRLGSRTRVDTVRITWPNGLVQNETALLINKVAAIKEAPRLAGSCPMIFTWNGERFEFITDVLGVAPLGASAGDGEYFPVDHDEYVSIPGGLLRERDGQYDIRVTEELREVSYLDQIKLIALDHPAAIDVLTNEKFKSPPFPEFRLFGGEARLAPVSARDERGADVRAALLERDRRYPDAFRRDAAGSAELHRLDLDFGSAARSNRAALVLSGWVDWADGSTFLAAQQAHRDLVFPYLQVKDAEGNWKTVVEDMGIPSGKPKTMAVDLAGKFLSSSREVRIVTSLCVYWDQIYLLEESGAPPHRMTDVATISADLHFRGFSKPAIDPQRKQPESFDYQEVRTSSPWNPTPGNYTRYGDVKAVLQSADDRMAVIGSGDEIGLRFDSRGLPPLPSGWKRDFLLLVDGWAKDADFNTAFSQSVQPLPFHAMSRYPYPANERFPGDPAVSNLLTRPALRLIRPLHEGATR
jgi:Flp pilus assembly protein TadD